MPKIDGGGGGYPKIWGGGGVKKKEIRSDEVPEMG